VVYSRRVINTKPLALLTCLFLQLAQAPAQGRPDTVPRAASAFDFYDDANPMLSVTRPLERGIESFESRARALSGGEEPFGIVLSGGSARAFAHIGVLRALEGAGIHPDYLVADSMGAIVALLYGAGVSPDDIERLFEAFPPSSLFDPELPLSGGFLNSSRFSALLRFLVGDLDLSDLPIPVLVLCEDLSSRRQLRLAEGDFTTVLLASFALPAVFEPVKLEGFRLIDGGITALVPVEAAYEFGSRVVVATALYNRSLDLDNAFVVLNRSIDIGKTRRSIEELLRYRPAVIRCDVEGLSYMEFSRPREIAARGEASARAVLPEIAAISPPRALPEGLLARRTEFSRRIDTLIAVKARGGAPGGKPDLWAMTEFRLLDEADNGFPFLQGLRYAGLGASGRAGGLTSKVAALAGLDGDASHAWGAKVDLGLTADTGGVKGLGSTMGISALALGAFQSSSSQDLPRVEPRLGIVTATARLAWSAGGPPARNAVATASALASVEARAEARFPLGAGDPGQPGPSWDVEGGFVLGNLPPSPATEGSDRIARSRPLAEAGLHWLFDADGNAGPSARLAASLPLGPNFVLRLRDSVRVAFEGPGWDEAADFSFRGPPIERLATGRALASLDLVWRADVLEFDLGESLIFQRPELGLYVDAACAANGLDLGSEPPFIEAEARSARMVVGMAAQLGASILGLSPFDLSFHAGWALDGSGLAIGLRAGLLTR
jgi:predicted acylesterase/phospholipase RssA